MMTLTLSKTRKGIYDVHVDEELIGCLPDKLIPAEYFISTPTDKKAADFIKAVKEWTFKNGQTRLVDYLAKIERTVFDSKNHLRRWSVPDDMITKIINDAIQKKWLSDERYTRNYIEEMILTGRSPQYAKFKLHKKKIAHETIAKVIAEEYDQKITQDLVIDIIDKLITKYEGMPERQQFERIASALYRRGFDYVDYEDVLKMRIRELNQK